MKSSQVFNLYKMAVAPSLVKVAKMNADTKALLIGALGGSGVGLISHLLTPKDEDEDQTKRLLSHILAGAATGSLAGYGASKLRNAVKDTPIDVFPTPGPGNDGGSGGGGNGGGGEASGPRFDPGYSSSALTIGGLAASPYAAGFVSDRMRDRSINKAREVITTVVDPVSGKKIVQRHVGPGKVLSAIADIGAADPSKRFVNPPVSVRDAQKIYNEALSTTGKPSLFKRIISSSARKQARQDNLRLFQEILAAQGSNAARVDPASVEKAARKINLAKVLRSLSGKHGVVRSAANSKVGRRILIPLSVLALGAGSAGMGVNYLTRHDR